MYFSDEVTLVQSHAFIHQLLSQKKKHTQKNTFQSEIQKLFILKYIPLLPVDRNQLTKLNAEHAEESGFSLDDGKTINWQSAQQWKHETEKRE